MGYLYGSSILCHHHNFPLHFREQWPADNTAAPYIFGKRGGRIDNDLVKKIMKNAENHQFHHHARRQIIGLCCIGKKSFSFLFSNLYYELTCNSNS